MIGKVLFGTVILGSALAAFYFYRKYNYFLRDIDEEMRNSGGEDNRNMDDDDESIDEDMSELSDTSEEDSSWPVLLMAQKKKVL
jgi:hypothetical protein